MKVRMTRQRMAVLAILGNANECASDISETLGIPVDQGRKILKSLERHGLITKEAVYGGKWRLV